MKNKVEDVIENFILDKFLRSYRNSRISSGGDINEAEQSALRDVKQMINLGSKSKLESLKEELRYYLDFHEKRDGLINRPINKQELYIKVRDKQVDEKANEILKTVKNLIKSEWKKKGS